MSNLYPAAPSKMANYEPRSVGPAELSEEAYETTSSADGHLEHEKRSKDGGALEKKVSKASVNNMSSIPNGGLKAWLQVLGAFFLMFNTWSVTVFKNKLNVKLV